MFIAVKPRVPSVDSNSRVCYFNVKVFLLFSVQQQLLFHGPYENSTLFAPLMMHETKMWVAIQEGEVNCSFKVDDIRNYNAPKIRNKGCRGHYGFRF